MSHGISFGLAPCVACGHVFAFHPERVPSLKMFFAAGAWHPDPAGRRHPLCRPCWDRFNDNRARAGLPRYPTLPGAYDLDEPDDGGDS